MVPERADGIGNGEQPLFTYGRESIIFARLPPTHRPASHQRRPLQKGCHASCPSKTMPLLPLPLLALVVGAYAGSVTDYAPRVNQPCPTDPLIRVFTPQNQSLHPREQDYVNTRLSQVIPNEWKNWVGNGTSIGYSLDAFGGNFSKIGIAVSGGGYRAAQFGAGVFSGLDARNDSAKAAGTGGLLQVSSYWAGLSGASTAMPSRRVPRRAQLETCTSRRLMAHWRALHE